jgi:hypothetical protein
MGKVKFNMSTKYNVNVWSDFDIYEKRAYRIYEAYQSHLFSKGVHVKLLPSAESKSHTDANHIRAHKNWKYFFNLNEEFKYSPSFDANQYMDAIFKQYETYPQPAQICTKTNIKKYKEFRERMLTVKSDDDKSSIEQIFATARYIKSKVGGLDPESLRRFFEDKLVDEDDEEALFSIGVYSAMNGLISPLFFSVSKSFWNAYKNLDQDIRDEIMEKDRLIDLGIWVRLRTHVFKFLVAAFPGDIS